VKKGDGCSERVVVDTISVQRRAMAATAEKVMAGGGDNSVFVVINLMLTSFDGWGRGQLSIGCDQFNVNIIIY
jgi:hypothetical protein